MAGHEPQLADATVAAREAVSESLQNDGFLAAPRFEGTAGDEVHKGGCCVLAFGENTLSTRRDDFPWSLRA
jgi:hypothetical protein